MRRMRRLSAAESRLLEYPGERIRPVSLRRRGHPSQRASPRRATRPRAPTGLVGLSFGWMSATPAETRTRPARAIGLAEHPPAGSARRAGGPGRPRPPVRSPRTRPPPTRQGMSAERTTWRMRSAILARTASPARWPIRSLISLKPLPNVHDHEREPPLVPLGAVNLAAERLVEIAAVVEARPRIEVRELPRLAEPARVLDRRRHALRELLEPARVVVPEPDIGVAGEDAEPADLAVAAEERDAECLHAPLRPPAPPRTGTSARSPGPPAAPARR